MTTETQELKPLPCPLCGGKFVISQEPRDNGYVAGMYYLHHTARGSGPFCHLTYYGHFKTKDEILTAWNTRPREAELEAEVGRLRAWLSALEPHLDAVICYASDMDEHPPNRVVAEVRAYLSHPKGADE